MYGFKMRCYKISGPPNLYRDIYASADCLLCFATRPRVSIVVEPGFLGWERSEKPAKSVITVGCKIRPDFGDVARELHPTCQLSRKALNTTDRNMAATTTTASLSLASRGVIASPRRIRANVTNAARVPRRSDRALTVVAAAGKKKERQTSNLIKPKPMYEKGEEPWWIDPETGKAPGYLQLTVFMASQLFVGTVMQPFALWYGQLFDLQNCTGIGC